MKFLAAGMMLSYLITWCSGLYFSRSKKHDRVRARRIHFGLSLVT